MLKVALGGLHRDRHGGKGGKKGVKIGSMRRKGNLASEKGHFKHIGRCPALRGVTVLTERMNSLSKRTRNWSTYEGWLGIWSCKREVGIREENTRSGGKGRIVSTTPMEQGPINLGLIGIGTAHGNMKTGTRFLQRRGDLGMPPWMR